MPDTTVLEITPRTELRKQNRGLRAAGGVPGVVYGHRVDPVSVTLPRRGFERAFHKVGRTQLLDLKIDGEGSPRKVLVREVQYDPRGGGVLHVDFYQVNLKKKITADVPVVLVGESPAVQRHDGELQQNVNSLRVSCLPADIPEHVEVDVSGLEAVDDGIRVGQLYVPAEVEILNDPEELVVKIAVIREIEEEEPVEVEGEEVEGEEGEAAEGEAAEGAEGAAEGEGGGGEGPSDSSGSEEG
jgi:large subunit ribosomal protein L25